MVAVLKQEPLNVNLEFKEEKYLGKLILFCFSPQWGVNWWKEIFQNRVHNQPVELAAKKPINALLRWRAWLNSSAGTYLLIHLSPLLSLHEVKVSYSTNVWQALWAAQPNRNNPLRVFLTALSISQLSLTDILDSFKFWNYLLNNEWSRDLDAQLSHTSFSSG